MQYEKAPGPNNIPTEAFKNLTGAGFEELQRLIGKFWDDPDFLPQELTEIKLRVLPKKGDLSNPNKWRGIALGDVAAKTVSSILTHRLTKHLGDFGIDEQCGCLFRKGCTDATFSLKTALQTLREHGQSAYVLFVDLVKAFDSANRELLWRILEIYGVPEEMITVIKKLHKDVTYQMKVGSETTKIKTTVGVKQGDNLGPILFIVLVNAVAASLNKKWKEEGIETPDFRWHGMKADGSIDRRANPQLSKGTRHTTQGKKFTFFNSYYVDDAAFILLNREDLEKVSRLIQTHFRRFGLTVHCGDKRNNEDSKTEALFIPTANHKPEPDETNDIMLNDHEYFGFCHQFKYLGTTFDDKLEDSTDIKKRIQKATGAFAVMAKLLKDPELDHKLRVRAYEATVLNILLFGCESWALKVSDRRKLETCHHRSLRSMLGISIHDVKDNRIRNSDVREELGCYSLSQNMEIRRARWLEKLANMTET